jgi:hypothetical protein
LLCTIYFGYIDTFIWDVPPPPPYDDEEMMFEATTGQGPKVQIPDDNNPRPDAIFWLELGD